MTSTRYEKSGRYRRANVEPERKFTHPLYDRVLRPMQITLIQLLCRGTPSRPVCPINHPNPDKKKAELATYQGAWTAMTLLPIHLWHWEHLQNRHQRQSMKMVHIYSDSKNCPNVWHFWIVCDIASYAD
jgi:hypothetical protein